ncbi:MAG: CRISPR-associated helicase Cas3' [Aggregatilineales bacterium]
MLSEILARPRERLTDHTRAVVEAVRALAQLRPLPAHPRLYDRLVAAAWLHDSGKLSAAFQRGLRRQGKNWGLRHEVLSLAFLPWLELPDGDRPWVIAAIATHHRDATFILNHYRASTERPQQLISSLRGQPIEAWYDWLGEQGVTLRPYEPPAVEAINTALRDLDSFIDQLAEAGINHFNFTETVLLRGLMLQADHRAAANVALHGAVNLDRAAIERRVGQAPYTHQRACQSYAGKSALLIAPTGAGKTEAALLWAAASSVPRLFYMLPYRVSMNAMHARLRSFTPHVGLQHGRALTALYRRLLDDGLDSDDALAQAKAQATLARLHALPVRVFSPYHLLRASYRLKGFEALLADCYGAHFIIDEIHAYRPERLALFLGTLKLLSERFDARLLIMTATLPPRAHAAIRAALGDLPIIRAEEALYRAFQRHRLQLHQGDLFDHLDAIQQAADHAATLIVVNTVRRARQVADALTAAGAEVLLLHGRFNMRDRWQREQQLLARFAPGSRRAGPHPIVVSTQVIEVSLDLDFDVLHSDPAPLDALLQRFGRVNRSRRQRDLAPVHVYSQPTGAEDRFPVYQPELVADTLRVLADRDGTPIDEARVEEWLAAAYARADWWDQAYRERLNDFERWVLCDYQPLESAEHGLARQFSELFDDYLVLPLELEDEYKALLPENPIEADDLLVPLARAHYKMLEREGRAWRGDDADEGLFFADAPYDPAFGLQIYQYEEEE